MGWLLAGCKNSFAAKIENIFRIFAANIFYKKTFGRLKNFT